MPARVNLEDVTAELVRDCGRIYVTDQGRFALLSKDRVLPRFRGARGEGRMSPPELHVIVDELNREVFDRVAATVRALDADRAFEDFASLPKPGSSPAD